MRMTSFRLWLLLTVVWMTYGFVYAEQLAYMSRSIGQQVAYIDALIYAMGGYLTWIPASYLLLILSWRHPLRRGAARGPLCILGAALAGIIVAKAAYIRATNEVFGWYDALPPFAEIVVTSVRNNLLTGCLVIAAAHGIALYRQAHRRELQISELQTRLAGARLEALSAQINPHFLFNALNSIAELLHQDAQAADRMLVQLSALLRRSLDSTSELETPLRDELELLEHYLGIEGVRLGARLRVEWDIAPECEAARVPALILQPIVENAIVHGIARRRAPGRVRIRARRDGGRLRIDIEDDGAPDAGAAAGHGIGLRNTRARLQCLYGDDCSFALVVDRAAGTCARLSLPFATRRRLPPAAADGTPSAAMARPSP